MPCILLKKKDKNEKKRKEIGNIKNNRRLYKEIREISRETLFFFKKKIFLFFPQQEMFNRIIRHYNVELVQQLLSVIGSVDVLGNPAGFVDNLGTGFKDFINKPLEVKKNK